MTKLKLEQESRVGFDLTIEDKNYSAFFSSRDIKLSGNPEWYLACSLLLLMKKHVKKSTISGPISPLLFSSLDKIQDLLHSFENSIGHVHFRDLVPGADPITGNDRVGAFFTGGVDSFYTLLKNKDDITDMIYVQGYDLDLDNDPVRKQVSDMLYRVANRFGKNVIEIESDYRFLIHPIATWSILSHGTALAAVGHLLADKIKRVYIPSTLKNNSNVPWG